MFDNNKCQVMIMKLMMAILIMIATVAITQPLVQIVDETSNSTNLNCTSVPSTDYTKVATCVVVDNYIFMIIGTFICVGMSFVAGSKNGFGVINAIVIFIITMVLISPLKYWIGIWRDASHLSCTTTTSVAAKMSCILADAWLFWFVVLVIGASLTYLFNKKVTTNVQ